MGQSPETMSASTPSSLLRAVSANKDSPRWDEFARIYAPLIRRYVEQSRAKALDLPSSDVDDIAQDFFISIFNSMQGFHYDRARGRFRHYLSRAVANLVRRRGEKATANARRTVPIDGEPGNPCPDSGQTDETRETMLKVWTLALSRVLQSGRFDPNTKALFRRLVLEQAPVNEVAAEFRKTPNNIYQIKDRVLKSVHRELVSHGLGQKSLDEIQESLEAAMDPSRS